MSLIPRVLADFRAVAARMQEVDERKEREATRRGATETASQGTRRASRGQPEVHLRTGAPGRRVAPRAIPATVHSCCAAAHSATDTITVWTCMASPTDFLAWAEHYIDQLDPLSAADHDSDLTPRAVVLLPTRIAIACRGSSSASPATPGNTPRNSLPSRRRATTTQAADEDEQ